MYFFTLKILCRIRYPKIEEKKIGESVANKDIVFPINKEFKANLDVWFTKGEDDWKIDYYGDYIAAISFTVRIPPLTILFSL